MFSFNYPTTATETIRASISITKNTPSTISSTAKKIIIKVTSRSCLREEPQRLYQHFVLQDFLHLLEYHLRFFDN